MAADLVSAGNQSGECRSSLVAAVITLVPTMILFFLCKDHLEKRYRGIGGQRIICQEIMEAEYESFSFLLKEKVNLKRTLESGMQSGA